jgi:hypothetical protein
MKFENLTAEKVERVRKCTSVKKNKIVIGEKKE